jgi:hypothetical protein
MSEQKEWTYGEFGKLLADELKKDVFRDFDRLFSEGHFNNMDRVSALKEWIYFKMFIMFSSVSLYFKDIGLESKGHILLDYFHKSCYDIFISDELFASHYINFRRTLLSRYATYAEALQDTREPSPLHWLGKEFCKRCGYKEGGNIITIFVVAATYGGCTNINENFLKSSNIAEHLHE